MNAYAPTPRSNHRARATREPVALVCEVRQGLQPWARVNVYDISTGGLCMDWLPIIDSSRSLRVRIPGFNVLNGHIRWRKDMLMGVEFTSQLYGPVLDHIARRAARRP